MDSTTIRGLIDNIKKLEYQHEVQRLTIRRLHIDVHADTRACGDPRGQGDV